MKLLEKCERCDGEGMRYDLHCAECGRRFDQEEIAEVEARMPRGPYDEQDVDWSLPCGHDINRLRESDWCAECEGTGKIPTDEGRELIEFMRWYERAG